MIEQNKNKQLTAKLCSKLLLAMTILSIGLSAVASEAQNHSEKTENSETAADSSHTVPSSTVEEQEPSAKTEEPLDFSSTGRSGQQTAGESRGGCPQVEIPLSAIASSSNVSKTIASHPQWWFYNPYSNSSIKQIEFVIQNQQRQDVLRNNLTHNTDTFYLSATIPDTHSGLQENQWYRWYLKIYCHQEKNSVPLFVSGWVKRVIPDIEDNISFDSLTIQDYIQHNLWLDAINFLFTDKISNSSDSNYRQIWQQTISSSEIDLNLPFPKNMNFDTHNLVVK